MRSGPDTRSDASGLPGVGRAPTPALLVYLGIMGPQDGVDTVLDVWTSWSTGAVAPMSGRADGFRRLPRGPARR